MKGRKSERASLKNLGKKSERMLNDVGVYNRDELAAVGAVRAYRVLKGMGYPVSLNLIYAIQGALLDIHWTALPRDLREKLVNQGESELRRR